MQFVEKRMSRATPPTLAGHLCCLFVGAGCNWWTPVRAALETNRIRTACIPRPSEISRTSNVGRPENASGFSAVIFIHPTETKDRNLLRRLISKHRPGLAICDCHPKLAEISPPSPHLPYERQRGKAQWDWDVNAAQLGAAKCRMWGIIVFAIGRSGRRIKLHPFIY